MFELLARRPFFRLLWAAGAISLIGDWLAFVAISRLTLDQGGGPLSLALVYASHVLPHAWAMPLTGVVADRYDRKRLLMFVPLIQAVLTAAMVIPAASGALFALQVLVVVRATFGAFMPPAETAALRHTVEPDELVQANALLGGTWSVMYVVGMALGGALATLGPTLALLLDAGSFVVGALLAARLPAMRPPASSDSLANAGRSFVLTIPHDLEKAFNHARLRADLFRAMLGKAPVALGGGAGWILLNLVADRTQPLGIAAMSLGILQAVRGPGTGLGPVGATWICRGATPSRTIERLSVVLSLGSIAAFAWSPAIPALLVMMTLLWGIGAGTNWVLVSANLQRLAPDDMIGRLSSLDELCNTACLVLGAVIAALLLEAGLTMPQVALIGTGLGMVLFVWLDQRQPAASKQLSAADASGS